MRQPRASMKSVWLNRRKEAFAKDRKRLKEGLASIQPFPADHLSEESSEEEAASRHKTPLSCQPTTSLSPSVDMKTSNPPTIATSSNHSTLFTLTDLKPARSTDTLLSPHMSPTCQIDPFDSDDDSLSSDDSIF